VNLPHELELMRCENDQLRALCAELEQALQEATQDAPLADAAGADERLRDYEALLDEKTETIRQLHQQLEEARAAVEEAQARQAEAPPPRRQGPIPREEELLSLSEDLERERRQLQDDEATLMDQMRQMEMSMARERAEMARQRNDLQRLYGEVRHELDRLERNGALQSKMDELKAKLQDVSTRRGAAPSQMGHTPASSSSGAQPNPAAQVPPANTNTSRPGGSFMGRLFGGGNK
jgi:hypothetical protein